MLRNMFIGDPPGNHDRILDFSTAVTGTLFFVPTADLLDDPPPAPTDGPPPPVAGPPAARPPARSASVGCDRPDREPAGHLRERRRLSGRVGTVGREVIW